MAYYSDEDRKRAAAKRKLNSQIRQLTNSPEDAYDILGVSVPHVSIRPTLDEYGLSSDVEKRLEQLDEKHKRNEKTKRVMVALVLTSVLIGLFVLLTRQSNEAIHPENFENGRLTNNILAWSVAIISYGGFFGIISSWIWAFDVKPKETSDHTQYKKYKEQLSYYNYWQRKNSKNHWSKMTGQAFEQAIANLFRNIGFAAEVSKIGGDGGVDIILQKSHRRIAVQCKRYKSAVGPHVIRDLWGTMQHNNFKEGCIVTTTGFTKGVTAFAEGKKIFLIDLNDILRATAAGGTVYFSKKMAELR
jgi:restriction system protein